MTDQPPMPSELQRSSRDLEAVRTALEKALAQHIPGSGNHRVSDLAGTTSTGMSSETLLFDATWDEPDGPRVERLVARVAPDAQDVPVFPSYNLPAQFAAIKAVAELTDVPVPPPWWCEPDPSVIGSPFFVMGRVDGDVPPDIMPYNFGDSWLFKASPDQQARLAESTISVLARLHAVEQPEQRFSNIMGDFPGQTALRRHLASRRHWYEWAALDCGRSELIDRAFTWLEDRFPADEGQTVLSWGDSRIGNIMYRDFEPVAVLDWEMAGVGPRELDLAWLLYMHKMFEDMAALYGFPGMPDFLRPEDGAATYEKLTGHSPRYLDWYMTYSCLQLSIVYLRTGQRSVRFGEREAPAQVDEFLMNGPTLAAMISEP